MTSNPNNPNNQNNQNLGLPDIGPMITPTVPITPAQEVELLNLFANLQTTVTAYFADPSTLNRQELQGSLNQLYIFLRDQFPTVEGRNATRYSMFLLLTTVNVLAGSPEVSQVANVLQAVYNTLSIFIAELLTSSPAIKNQLLNILLYLVSITSTMSFGILGPTGASGPTGLSGSQGQQGPPGSQGPQGAKGRPRNTRTHWADGTYGIDRLSFIFDRPHATEKQTRRKPS
ncbi:collagen-like repeat preface domain-containing protein [Bacillus cereus]|uniref:collagen-like repeat preface domain-containing protein n=1 Tax=Bacillus cereus TaxID=1396 RepID=UPI001D7CFC2E|nr:collagen-like repeat preface domain-containing protein [Bacillus cereus]MBG9613177.1 hypothetical protein [Bacillus cereus]